MNQGILPSQNIRALSRSGGIISAHDLGPTQFQPASLDLTLGDTAYRLRASFLPGADRKISDCLDSMAVHSFDITKGAVLETGCVYLVPLREGLNLPGDIEGLANPKSSTGRLDVFTRVICDNGDVFDHIMPGYSGPLYVEISPLTFSILLRPGDKLVQIRFRRGEMHVSRTQTVSIDLCGPSQDAIIGWRARRHAGMVDLRKVGGHKPLDYWEPLHAPDGTIVLDPDEFYILASKEAVSINPNEAAEMAPIAPEIGEFRAHYAGFFDPGFGCAEFGGAGSRAVLEVRGRDVPFILRHGQPVAKLVYESMTDVPDDLYGGSASHYQAQGLRLSKHFGAS